ncbi:hypothetical protein QX249_10910 [Vibrio parahaemolyticus]|uniref:BTB domain-containing protein n=1 Tax=Vibrio parahaemolyticus TaxID=670 RepID=A0AAW8PY46_VIBPH|nr:hypothetical protein [Vibrio parahaemolyticus]MDS1821172.1 hypothetical protein [Vibrio parahaemolyticus]
MLALSIDDITDIPPRLHGSNVLFKSGTGVSYTVDTYLTKRSHVFAMALYQVFSEQASIEIVSKPSMTDDWVVKFFAYIRMGKNYLVDAGGMINENEIKSRCVQHDLRYSKKAVTYSALLSMYSYVFGSNTPEDSEIDTLVSFIRNNIDIYYDQTRSKLGIEMKFLGTYKQDLKFLY